MHATYMCSSGMVAWQVLAACLQPSCKPVKMMADKQRTFWHRRYLPACTYYAAMVPVDELDDVLRAIAQART